MNHTSNKTDQRTLNNQLIASDLKWLESIIDNCIPYLLGHEKSAYTLVEPEDISGHNNFYPDYISRNKLTKEERLVLILAFTGEVRPGFMGAIAGYNKNRPEKSPSFGGMKLPHTGVFVPTIKTALTLLAGPEIEKQMAYWDLFDKKGPLLSKGLIAEPEYERGIICFDGHLAISGGAFNFMTRGHDVHHEYSSTFPAVELTTKAEWDDLVLSSYTRKGLDELVGWLNHEKQLKAKYGLSKHITGGHKALFYGPSGTGKTFTASLLGKRFNKPVYRIDLSRMVSKYVGETEKNLETLFNHAEKRDWILFFDEADSLFASRTSIASSNDRFANQETAYLLQKIETCSNLIILATNKKANIDAAFTRRFQTILDFEMPRKEERLQLWKNIIPGDLQFDPAISLTALAEKFDIAGGNIANVVRYSAVMSLDNKDGIVSHDTLVDGLRKEYRKIGRTF